MLYFYFTTNVIVPPIKRNLRFFVEAVGTEGLWVARTNKHVSISFVRPLRVIFLTIRSLFVRR